MNPSIWVPFAILFVTAGAGWVISVERRITTLQAMADDIHAIRESIERAVMLR